jgi:hypothetical protein
MQTVLKSLAAMTLLSIGALAQEADTTASVRPAMLDNPDGKGHPNAVTCRKPQQLPGQRLMAPPVCLINERWAELRRNGQDVSPDGTRIVASEKDRSLNPSACHPTANVTRGSAMGASMGTGLIFSPDCF